MVYSCPSTATETLELDDLGMLLASTLRETTFDLDRVEFPRVGRTDEPVWRSAGGRITVARYCELHQRNRWDEDELRLAKAAALSFPERRLADLDGWLREHLEPFIDADSGRIGHAMPLGQPESMSAELLEDGVYDVQYSSSVGNFAEGLIRRAGVLGPERIVWDVAVWRKGEPVRLCVCAVVEDLTLDNVLEPLRGVRVETLPAASDRLPAWLTERIMGNDYLRRSVVSVEVQAAPPLFRPDNAQIVRSRGHGAGVDAVCRALSLECGEYSMPVFLVADFGDLASMSRSGHGLTWGGTGRLGLVRSTDRVGYDRERGVTMFLRPI